MTRMVAYLLPSHFPSLNILVNNAGIQHIYDFRQGRECIAEDDEEIDINFRAVARLTKMVLPNLVRRHLKRQ